MNDFPPPVLQVRDLYKHFNQGKQAIQALRGVSMQAESGQITGLIGPDGAGKTTLMRIIAGLLLADQGETDVLGIDVHREPLRVQASIAYMPQRFGLYEDLSIQENLDLYADLQGVAHSERPARYARLLEMTGLTSFTRRLTGHLSGGMKQKLGLACTLVRPPRLLLLDEPTVGVDPESRRELWRIVQDRVAEGKMSVLLSTAYLDEAERCAKVVLMHEGRVLGEGDPRAMAKTLAGRVWYVRQDGVSRRRLLKQLLQLPEVGDAIIYLDGVRVMLLPQVRPPTLPETRWEPLAPSFENAFVDRLQQTLARKGRGKTPVDTALDTRQYPISTQEVVITTHGLKRRFGSFYAVQGIDFEVRRGEIFGLLGANGAGKSTTFRMLCGLLPPSEGYLSVAGVDLRTAPATARARIGYMSQKFALYGQLSVIQNIRFFARTYGLRGTQQRERIDWAIHDFQLESYVNTNADELPLGFKQRLATACALMHEPDILFLDEPTSGVDPLERREFWVRINALAESGVTIMITTHFMDEAEYCDRIMIMARGRILVSGTPREIRTHAATPDNPHPDMEDAFLRVIEKARQQEQADAT